MKLKLEPITDSLSSPDSLKTQQAPRSSRFLFFIFMMLWIARASSESLTKAKPDAQFEQPSTNNFESTAFRFSYCEPEFHPIQDSNICEMISADWLSLDEALQLSETDLSRHYQIYSHDDLRALVSNKQIPVTTLLQLSSDVFDYFTNFHHEKVIGLAALIHAGKLSYADALTNIRNMSLPSQLRSVIVHYLVINDKLSIEEASQLDNDIISKLMSYQNPPCSFDDSGYEKLIKKANFELTQFVIYPKEFVCQLKDSDNFMSMLENNKLTLEAVFNLTYQTIHSLQETFYNSQDEVVISSDEERRYNVNATSMFSSVSSNRRVSTDDCDEECTFKLR